MISPRLALAASVLTVAVAVPSVVVAADASSASTITTTTVSTHAAPKAKTFANCTAINKTYSGGIAKKGVKYNTVTSHGKSTHRALKGNVKFDTDLYNANKKSDRDKDGIACEKS